MVNLNALLIAGTDTEVGKTVVTSALLAYYRHYFPQRSLGLLKPIQSGVGDGELYQRLFFPHLAISDLVPQAFAAPLAPPLAAALENRQVDLNRVWQTLGSLCQAHDWVLVEGLGGLGSPITADLTLAALAGLWRLPVILVVAVKLGAIAQAVANGALARQERLNLRGIILNCHQPCTDQEVEKWAPASLISRLTQVPVLGVLPYLEDATSPVALAEAARGLMLDPLDSVGSFSPGLGKSTHGPS
ncbi:MAG: dethiobiotin synthase [Nodosilinea sp.]